MHEDIPRPSIGTVCQIQVYLIVETSISYEKRLSLMKLNLDNVVVLYAFYPTVEGELT